MRTVLAEWVFVEGALLEEAELEVRATENGLVAIVKARSRVASLIEPPEFSARQSLSLPPHRGGEKAHQAYGLIYPSRHNP
jgi:hypothetical protein